MIAIETKYTGPTNTRGSRIIATTCNGHRLTVSYSSLEDGDDMDMHKQVAERLIREQFVHNTLDRFELFGGGTKQGYAFVLVTKKAASC